MRVLSREGMELEVWRHRHAGHLVAHGGLGCSAGYTTVALAGHKYLAKDFLNHELDSRKSLNVSHRDASTCVGKVNLGAGMGNR